MIGLLAIGLLASPVTAATPPASPTAQTLVHHNARMALREGKPTEALKLWLLRNAIESKTHKVSVHDDDLRGATWVALGDLGLCPDGFAPDEGGLWAVAQHNWYVRNMRRIPGVDASNPFDAFRFGRQQRRISMIDVLDATELKSVTFQRTACWLKERLLFDTDISILTPISDRRSGARVLRRLLFAALKTLEKRPVIGRSVLTARIFDLNLQLNGLNSRAARRRRQAARREARAQGQSAAQIAAQFGEPEASRDSLGIEPGSKEGVLLYSTLSWSAEEWMALSSDRRQFLAKHGAPLVTDQAQAAAMRLSVIDRLTNARQGAELQSWIAHLTADQPVAARRSVWEGARGLRLLALDAETGFTERGVISLHRGVGFLGEGKQAEAIRALAYALKWAETSASAEEVRALARRWLSFVASQYRMTDALFVMLRTVVPRGDFTAVLEDQIWHAALNADAESFERCARHQKGRGALNRRMEVLGPLARGDAQRFVTTLNSELAENPYFVMRFLRRFLDRVQREDAAVRLRLVPVLGGLKQALEREMGRAEGGKRSQRTAEALITEIRRVTSDLTAWDQTESDRAAQLSPDREVFAGALRVAPTDALPWPFRVASVRAPQVFAPIKVKPVEWRDENGGLVFGWRISD